MQVRGSSENKVPNINRLMSEELLSNDRRVKKTFDPTGIRTTAFPLQKQQSLPTVLFVPNFSYAALVWSANTKDHSKMKN